MGDEFFNTSQIRSDHGSSGSKRLEHNKRTGLEPLRRNDKNINFSEKLKNLFRIYFREEMDTPLICRRNLYVLAIPFAIAPAGHRANVEFDLKTFAQALKRVDQNMYSFY